MHPSAEQLGSFLAGTLPADDERSIEAHIDGCETCRSNLSEVVRQRFNEKTLMSPVQADVGLPVQVGSIVLGRFRVEKLLGVGGMGCVFEAHHLQLNQRVALKFMLPEIAKDRSAVDRFVREARAAVRLVTEHVGKVLDLGTLDDGTPCLIMEFLQGETVEHRLEREGPFAPSVAVGIIQQVLLALEEAHGLGIVHRDLKPANLFLARRSNGTEVVKVLDFGIAKSIHPDIEQGLGATSQKTLLGSPLYMAPEQLSPGRPVDARVDLWALGCTLFQMLSGETPFRSRDLVELMYSIQKTPHPALRLSKPELSVFEPIIDACLAKDPERRVASAVALRGLLEGLKPVAAVGATTQSLPAKRTGLLAGLGLAVAASLAVGAVALWPKPPTVAEPVAPPPPKPELVVAVPHPVATPAPEDAGVVEQPAMVVERTVDPRPVLPPQPVNTTTRVRPKSVVKVTRPADPTPPAPPAPTVPDVLNDRL